MVVESLPFIDVLIEEKNNYKLSIRYFDENVSQNQLNWHKDKENRSISILKGNNVYLQIENDLPFKLEKNKNYFILKNTWHRVIKKSKEENFTILVKKFKDNLWIQNK